MEQWRERRAPGSNQAMREVAARMRPRISR
jgi:hypothetical protein